MDNVSLNTGDEIISAIATLDQIATSLESIAELAYGDSVSMESSSAEMLQLAVNQQLAPIGLKAADVSMEGLADTVKNIWKAIVAAIKKAVAWVAQLFGFLGPQTKRLKSIGEEIVAAAKVAVPPEKNVTVDFKPSYKAIAIDGKFDWDLVKNVRGFTSTGARVISLLGEVAEADAKTMVSMIHGSFTVDEHLKQIDEQVKKMHAVMSAIAAEKSVSGQRIVWTTPPRIGGKAVKLTWEKSLFGQHQAGTLKMSLIDHPDAKAIPKDAKLPLPSPRQINEIGEALIAMADDYGDVQKAVEEHASLVKKHYSEDLSKKLADKGKLVELVARRAYMNHGTSGAAMARPLMGHFTSMGNALIALAKDSLSRYSVPKKEKGTWTFELSVTM